MTKDEIEAEIRANKKHLKELKDKRVRHSSLKPCEMTEWLSKLYDAAMAKQADLEGKLLALKA